MSFFEDASLVLIPSAYKDQKVYSVKPTDGTGDLTFSRASSATRVASNGLIEKVRTNVITYSNTFSNAAWTKLGQGAGSVSVVTPNYTTDPFGGNNAWRFQCNLNGGTTSNDRSWMLQAFTSFADSVVSIYIKLNVAGSKTIILSNGSGDVQTITSTDWVRITKVTAGSSGEFRIGLIGGSTSDTLDCSIAFAQAETGVTTDYIATTTAAVSVGPVSGLPRLDYLGSTCPRLLLEPQRTNIKTSSENATGWGNPIGITTSLNVATSPDGYVNADKIIEAAIGGNHRFDVDFSATSGTAYTFSYFAKAAERTQCHIHGYSDNAVFSISTAIFDLSNGTIVSNTGGGTASIVDYGNGWYRVSLTLTAAATALGYWGFGVALNGATNYLGVATNGALFYGIQLEAGAYATSYIPTLGASVTRVADAASKTSATALIGQTEGTIFCDVNLDARSSYTYFVIAPNLGSAGTYIGIGITAGAFSFEVVNSGVQFSYNFPSTATGRFKLALGYKANDFVAYVNGVQVSFDTSGTVPTCSQVGLYQYDQTPSVKYNQALLFKTRLTNAQLAELTA
jgi:hypothetical protein